MSIHPWRDGDGGMARCLQTLVLARELILAPEFASIEEWLGSSPHNAAMYYQALAETQGGAFLPERDARGWVRFCLRARHLRAQLVQRRLDLAAEAWRVRADQAIRDLQGLKAAGLIEEIGHGRTQRYVAAGRAAEAERSIRAAHTSPPSRDPYNSGPR